MELDIDGAFIVGDAVARHLGGFSAEGEVAPACRSFTLQGADGLVPSHRDEGPTRQGLSKKLRPTCAGCGGGGHGEGVHSDELRKVSGRGWHWLGLQRPNGLGAMGRG